MCNTVMAAKLLLHALMPSMLRYVSAVWHMPQQQCCADGTATSPSQAMAVRAEQVIITTSAFHTNAHYCIRTGHPAANMSGCWYTGDSNVKVSNCVRSLWLATPGRRRDRRHLRCPRTRPLSCGSAHEQGTPCINAPSSNSLLTHITPLFAYLNRQNTELKQSPFPM